MVTRLVQVTEHDQHVRQGTPRFEVTMVECQRLLKCLTRLVQFPGGDLREALFEV
jgi:hypothetical protein